MSRVFARLEGCAKAEGNKGYIATDSQIEMFGRRGKDSMGHSEQICASCNLLAVNDKK